ncbi:MAG: hypothetical protein JAY74_27175 [Candidatus Thiodiazotropha taylori]|nr:hypothetical protein [Candidatus Thiodiazotropha taylori]MCG8090235.1 hypothetical protein [Candidatus Thiodiazotropha taylori]MCW4275613.1 hypothetical protein [Candidatus Thiodiazotropha taylori]
MDNTVGQNGNVSNGSLVSSSSIDSLKSSTSSNSLNSGLELLTTGEQIAGSQTTEERIKNTPSTSERLGAAKEISVTQTDEARQVEKTWERLRSYPEIKAIEAKVGEIKLTIDYAAETGYVKKTNEIIFNPRYLSEVEYKTVMTETIESSLADLPENEYWEFMDNYPKSYPFSFERMLVHEANHALQPNSQLHYTLNSSQFETPVIEQTNEFMWDNFKEPARDPNWH